MTKRILVVLAVVAMLGGLVSTVASADGDGWSPDGVWETDDGGEWVRFFERRGLKQAQWHSDSFGPCRGGAASSSSANWWFANGGVHVKVWATCDTALIRLRPFELWFAQEPDWDLFETNTETTWVNYLLHPPTPDILPGCYVDTGEPDLLYSGEQDTFGNLIAFGSYDGSCSGNPLPSLTLSLVVAATEAGAQAKCDALGQSPFVGPYQLHPFREFVRYNGFPRGVSWLCQSPSPP